MRAWPPDAYTWRIMLILFVIAMIAVGLAMLSTWLWPEENDALVRAVVAVA
jgi:hypothetical protein